MLNSSNRAQSKNIENLGIVVVLISVYMNFSEKLAWEVRQGDYR